MLNIHKMNRESILCDFIFASCNSLISCVNIRSSSIDEANMKSHKILYSTLIHVYVCQCILNRNGLYIEFQKEQYLHYVMSLCLYSSSIRQESFVSKIRLKIKRKKCGVVDLFLYQQKGVEQIFLSIPPSTKWCITFFGFDTYTIRITYRTAVLLPINFNVDTILRRWT